MTIKTIFLDRDGVINKEVNYLHRGIADRPQLMVFLMHVIILKALVI